MSERKASAAKSRRIADRLASVREARFIGRAAELALFESALAAARPRFAVLHLHGPGGVGKTTLLREFARLARRAGRTVIALDGRDIHPSRPDVLRALGDALGHAARTDPRPVIPDRSVVLLDTYETLSRLDTWLRDTLLPQLPAGAMVVLAGREPPGLDWRTDVAWAPLTRVVTLANFSPGESQAFLESRRVAATVHANVLDFTHGHPLALALVTDVLAERPQRVAFDPVEEPDMVQHLLALFLEALPSGRRREALDICAVARVTREPLLVELVGAEEGPAAFQWLRRQSFIESGARGLFPHDLARQVLLADARWRDSDGLRMLSRRIYSALHARIGVARGLERQLLQMDALYATRTRPTNAGFFDWEALDDARLEPAEPVDGDWIFERVERHEGLASARLARQWWSAQPSAFHVFRDAADGRFGFLALLDVAGRGAGTTPRDPAVAAALAFVDRHGPVRRGEGVVHLRWWMHARSYQAVTAAINLTAMHVVSHCMTRPAMAWNFVAMADPAFWAAHFDGVNFPRVPEADFEVGGRRYGVFAHDWRIEPPADWMMGARIPMAFALPADPAGSPAVLGEAEFLRAVRAALRDYTRPDALAACPLRSSRMLRGVRDASACATRLQELLREAAEALRANPRDQKLHRAVWHTYFEPLATQERVAERLELPFSTYRNHLRHAIERIGRSLWQRERASPPS